MYCVSRGDAGGTPYTGQVLRNVTVMGVMLSCPGPGPVSRSTV